VVAENVGLLGGRVDKAAVTRAWQAAGDGGWARARGWALALSLAFLAHSADNPLMAGIGQHTIEAVLG
jgi:hypothetical protein